jgi:hypothetical protein
MGCSLAVSVMRKYSKNAVDALLALRFLVQTFPKQDDGRALESVLQSDLEYLEEYTRLEQSLRDVTARIRTFCPNLNIMLTEVIRRLRAGQSLADCYSGFDKQETDRIVEALHVQCATLSCQLGTFRVRVEKKYRTGKAPRWTLGFFSAAGSLACIASIFAGLIGVLAIPVVGMVALGAGAIVFAGIAVAAFKNETERERAMDFLKNMDTRVKHLRSSIAEVRANTTLLSGADREECVSLLKAIMTECVQLC